MSSPEPGPSTITPKEAEELKKKIAELEDALRLQTEKKTRQKVAEAENYRSKLQGIFTDQQVPSSLYPFFLCKDHLFSMNKIMVVC